ncbi:MAG: hypothetical protein UT19_C0008G0020 [Candidatus Woesebacteria bacterium GW2011_GWB1_39_10b]|uniref:Uncharacterized protein n=3 Tax=Candidatus Woeseibacteriota TaxID=1752722 RepID=A0A0G0NB95_9BACT|nr:MAG: hypothetical protein US72_C0001G0116 [Microgenomates group bacterium GW2011_GWC1_38_12]KKQ93695.1 MAG: hypothetical protein UT19_C0008G0020 [Candidatus Woesebacteria bacterium GW2011_GWB1_39_10b]KKR13439.1 MAG: hypothetical protein UT40_C0017G0025 [Candidatus Woesebacteria bacterium GW2011_GWA1_39_21b]OGM63521.1 MAG: hypothetical protein A3A52_01300 [Candidatus Woesebacteria bacterium RIFCSPLOWO2_01_FULL_39_14]
MGKKPKTKPKVKRNLKPISLFIVILVLLALFSQKLDKSFKAPLQKSALQTQTSKDSEKSEKIELNGIKVNDFNKKAIKVGELDDVLFVDENGYNITYYPLDKAFLIVITSIPFEENRQEAEKRFLDELGIGTADACKLAVYITTPRAFNPNESGINYSLSFCGKDNR